METIILIIGIFLSLLYYIIIFDIILSWVIFFGINIKIKFISDITIPIYRGVKKIIPTVIGPFEFAPMIILFSIYYILYYIL